jgi:hypothetical protein
MASGDSHLARCRVVSGGVSVRDAAARLHCSEATIRRRVEARELVALPGPGPLRISAASVTSAQEDMLRRMGVDPPVRRGEPDAAALDLAAEVARLRSQVMGLKGALADLTAAHSAVLDTYRRLSEGVPGG